MQYLFFDIEGANCYNYVAKMCTFGYVITNEQFDVTSKIDVIINPESTFDKHILRKNMNAYSIKKYRTSPAFPYFYKSLKNILEKKEQLIIGWSIENDVRYIYDACKRYNKKQIKYEYFDLQKVVMKMEHVNNAPGLDSICEKYGIEKLISHKSDDDALLTMKIAQYICKEKNISLMELYNQNKDCVSTVNEFSSHLLSYEEIQERIKKRKVSYIISHCKGRNNKSNPLIIPEDIYGFLPEVIVNYTQEVIDMVHYIKDCGGQCSNDLSMCNKLVYITKPERAKKKEQDIQFVSYEKLNDMITKYQNKRVNV